MPLRPAALGDTCYALSQSRAAWDLYQACAECIVNYLRNVFLHRSDGAPAENQPVGPGLLPPAQQANEDLMKVQSSKHCMLGSCLHKAASLM